MFLKSLNVGQFQTALKTIFAEGVKANKYKKLPYTIWRQLLSYDERYMACVSQEPLSLQYKTFDVHFWIPAVWDEGLTSPNTNQEFGAFLLDYIQILDNEEGGKTMTTNTTSSNTSPSYTTTYATTTTTPINGNLTFNTNSNDIWTIQTSPTYTTWATTEDFCRKSEYPLNKKEEKKKEEKNMIKNFDFGPCTDNNVRMSMYGLAVKNAAGVWVSYNKDSKQIIDVDVFNFDGRKFLYKMPVAIDQIAVGDIVIHNRCPMFVINLENGIQVVDVVAGEQKTIMPATNMFGFNFVTKVVSFLDVYAQAPTPDQPFGNMLPFMMMDDNSDNNDNMLMAMMMMNGNMDMSNPMMWYCMSKDNKDMLPFMMMMNQKK